MIKLSEMHQKFYVVLATKFWKGPKFLIHIYKSGTSSNMWQIFVAIS